MSTVRKLWETCKSHLRRFGKWLKATVDEVIPSPKTQKIVAAILIGLDLLLAYLIALIHVGIWNEVSSIADLVELYIWDDYDYPFFLFLILTAAMVGVVFWLFRNTEDDGRNFKFSDSDVYGSAGEISMEDLEEVAEVKPIEALSGTILGQLDTTGRKVIGIPPNPIANKNMIVFGTPGVGKSFSIVKNQIVQAIRRGESVVCTDTKGELRADTIELARRYGYTIRNINLKNLLYSDGWDVLKELRCDDVRAMIFAEIVMKNTGNPTDPHLALEQSLLRACCLYVERYSHTPPNEKTFYMVYSMILKGPAELDRIFAMAKYDSTLRVAYDAYASFTGSDNLRNNVVANLASRLQILSSPPAQAMTSTDDIDLTMPGRQKCIFYVTMSDQHETMKFLASLFFSFLFLNLGDFADSQLSRRLPVPVCCILEEAANVGEIVGLTKYLSTARSRAISITMILQGLGQLREIYGDDATTTILNDCSIHACIGINERETAEHFEWLSGESTVKVKTEQHDKYESPLTANYRNSTGDGRRNVYTSNEVRRIKRGYILLGWQGYDTLMCRTFGINQHPEYIKGHMPTIPPEPMVPLANKEAMAYLRAMEEQRVMEYEAWEQDGGFAWEGYDFPKPQYNGPSRGKKKPPVIPYPELERMALAHAEQAAAAPHDHFAQQEPAEDSETAPSVQSTPEMPECPEPVLSAFEAVSEAQEEIPAVDQPVPAEPTPVAPENPPSVILPTPQVPSVPSGPDLSKLKAPTIEKPKRSGSSTLYATKTVKKK